MKVIVRVTFFLLLLVFLTTKPIFAQENNVNLYIFYSMTCPHCERELDFLEKIGDEYPNLNVVKFNVSDNKDNILLFQQIGNELKLESAAVPMTFIGNDYFLGYYDDEVTGSEIISLINKYQEIGDPDPLGKFINQEKITPTEIPIVESTETSPIENNNISDDFAGENEDWKANLPDTISLPLLGSIETKNLSLPALTFAIALLDGFNPCAMWVLLFLISLLLGMKDRVRMWTLGSTFIVASSFVYFLFLAAWLNLFLFLGFIQWVRILVGLLALILGTYQLRDYIKNRSGACDIVNNESRKRWFDKLREITQSKQFIFALIGIIILAFAVNLIELVCSAGLPAIYTRVLSLTPMPKWQYYLYLLFYVFIFMVDDLFVFVVAMTTLKAVGIESKYARFSRLFGGIIIFILGLLLIFKPELIMFTP